MTFLNLFNKIRELKKSTEWIFYKNSDFIKVIALKHVSDVVWLISPPNKSDVWSNK